MKKQILFLLDLYLAIDPIAQFNTKAVKSFTTMCGMNMHYKRLQTQ